MKTFFPSQKETDPYLPILKEICLGRPRSLREIQKEYGLDGALYYFYQKQISQKKVKDFRKTLEIFKTEYRESHKNYEVLVVAPPVGIAKKWSEHQIQGLKAVTRDAGFSRFQVFQETTTSVIEAAIQLRERLKEVSKGERPILLLSFSHGSSIVRFAMDQLDSYSLRSIAGWVNFSGLVFGSPYYTCPKKEPFFNKSAEKLLRSFSYEQRYFLKPIEDKGIPLISFLGCRASTDMDRRQRKAYHFLKAWGPSDGLVPFADYDQMPGVVVPVWGQGHFFDFLTFRSILQRTLGYLVSQRMLGGQKHNWGLAHEDFAHSEPVYEISF